MFALLWHRLEGKITRQQFIDMTDWEKVNVYGRPNRNEGRPERGYWPVSKEDVDDPVIMHHVGHKKLFMMTTGAKMKQLGASDEEVEERYKRWKGGMRP